MIMRETFPEYNPTGGQWMAEWKRAEYKVCLKHELQSLSSSSSSVVEQNQSGQFVCPSDS